MAYRLLFHNSIRVQSRPNIATHSHIRRGDSWPSGILTELSGLETRQAARLIWVGREVRYCPRVEKRFYWPYSIDSGDSEAAEGAFGL